MASYNPRKFADSDRLKEIQPARLKALLSPWNSYLAGRGIELPPGPEATFDYDTLAGVLMTPDSTTPSEMVDALFYVHETAGAEDMDELIAAIRIARITIADDPKATPIDLAIDVWLAAPEIVRSRHAEAIAMRQQNFEYFGPSSPIKGAFPKTDEVLLQQIQNELDNWFESRRRGRGCRVFVFRRKPTVWILVRHGQPMRREASQGDDGSAGAAFFRPQRHDVLIYDERSGDVGVHTNTKGERSLYLRTLGKLLFSGEEHFPAAERFTLDPLTADGSASLSSGDIDGIAAIRLVEYRRYLGGTFKEVESRKAEDIFGAFAQRKRTLTGGRLASATFKVKFDDSDKERSVTIRPPGIARFERNDDSRLIEEWLRRRGFILNGQGADDDDATTEVLEGAE